MKVQPANAPWSREGMFGVPAGARRPHVADHRTCELLTVCENRKNRGRQDEVP